MRERDVSVADVAERAEWRRRRQLERQLHDGAALRISALALRIGVLRHRGDTGAELDRAVKAVQDELHAVLEELRAVADKIYPPLLDQAGLGPALREAAVGIRVPTRVHAGPERFGAEAEGAAYFAITECLAALAPGSSGVDVHLRRELTEGRGPVLVADLVGVDAEHVEPVLGRVVRVGGTVDVPAVAGATMVTARIPCE